MKPQGLRTVVTVALGLVAVLALLEVFDLAGRDRAEQGPVEVRGGPAETFDWVFTLDAEGGSGWVVRVRGHAFREAGPLHEFVSAGVAEGVQERPRGLLVVGPGIDTARLTEVARAAVTGTGLAELRTVRSDEPVGGR